MAFRKFTDREGRAWEVRPRSRTEWEFQPVAGNPERGRSARAPGYEKDPFELSVEELQLLLDSSEPPHTRKVPSPFSD